MAGIYLKPLGTLRLFTAAPRSCLLPAGSAFIAHSSQEIHLVPEPGEPVRQVKDDLFGTATRQIVQQEGNSRRLNFPGRHFLKDPETQHRAGTLLIKITVSSFVL
jgi:hypothetical protein